MFFSMENQIDTSRSNDNINIIYDGQVSITSMDNSKLLGLILHEHLNFKFHVSYICSKLVHPTAIPYKLMHFVNRDILLLQDD